MTRLFAVYLALASASACSRPAGETRRPERARPLEPGSFQTTLNGFRIHYEVHGTGPVVMVLPNAWGITCGGLRAIFGGLEKQLTLVYFEPRGVGTSAPVRDPSDMSLAAVRDDFRALQHHLGLSKVDAIGWSNGAFNLVLLAAESPSALHSAIFVHGAASYHVDDGRAFARQHPAIVQGYRALRQTLERDDIPDDEKDRALGNLWLEQMFPASCADRATCGRLLGRAFGDMAFSWRHATYSAREQPIFDRTAHLARIPVPTLVIAGAHDSLPPSKAEEMHRGLPDSTLVVFDRSGHFAPLEQPADFERAVFDFLATSSHTPGRQPTGR